MMMKKQPFVSIIIVNHNRVKLIEECLDTLLEIDYPKDKFELIVIDNCSEDGSLEFIRSKYKDMKRVRTVGNKINNYCQACNLGIVKAAGEYIVLLNNDVKVTKNWLLELIAVVDSDNSIGAVTSKLLREDGGIQNAGLCELPNFYWEERGAGRDGREYELISEVDAISGACVLYRRAALNQVGFLDEDFVMFGEDVDMSLRLKKKNWRLVYVPLSIACHKVHGSCDESFAREAIEKNRLLLIAKHFPNKLSTALLGNTYFTVHGKTQNSGRFFDLLTEVFLKLVKEYPLEASYGVVREVFGEVKKIVNYENKKLEDDIKNMFGDLVETKKDRDCCRDDKEALQKEVDLIHHQLHNSREEAANLSNKLQEALDSGLFKDKEIGGLHQEIDNYREEIANLSNKLRESLESGLSKDNSIIELLQNLSKHKEEIVNLNNKLKESLDSGLSKDKAIVEFHQEIDNYREEIANLSNKLRESLEAGLSKDNSIVELLQDLNSHKEEAANLNNKLVELHREADNYREEILNLSNKLRESLESGLSKDSTIVELRHELDNYKEEIANLGNRLRESLESGLSKDTTIVELRHELDNYKEETANLGNKLRESLESGLSKDTTIVELRHELDNYKEETANLTNKLQESFQVRLELEKELQNIYASEGFRFILRPLWKIIWFVRLFFKSLTGRCKSFIWVILTIAMLGVVCLELVFFFLEQLIEILWSKFLPPPNKERVISPFDKLSISVVIPNYNGIELLRKCLDSIYAIDEFKNGNYEVLVVDDASACDIGQSIRDEFPKVRVVRNRRNQGFGKSCNRGVKEAKGELIVLLNNDIIVSKDFLEPLKKHFHDPEVFSVAPKLYYWDKQTFNYGMHMGRFKDGYLNLWNEAETGNGDKVSQTSPTIFAVGGAMVFRKKDFLWLGGFDHIYRPNCWEDIDISYRAQKRGLKVLYEPKSIVYHKGAATLNYVRHKEIKNELLFMWKNLNDRQMLLSHLMNTPRFLYRGKHSSRITFLRGYLWAFSHLIPALINRFQEQRYLKVSDRRILNRCMLYYRNFMRNNYTHREKKTVLLITPFMLYPLNCGGKIRIYNLYKRLSKKYNLILLSLIHHESENDGIAFLRDTFSEIYTIHTKTPNHELFFPGRYKYSFSRFLIEKLRDIQDKTAVDIAHIESNELLYLTKYIRHIPVVYTEHDISILSYNNSYYHKGFYDSLTMFLDYLKLVFSHHSYYRRINHVITLSKEDKRIIQAFSPQSDCSLIPTGVDLGHFKFSEKTGINKNLIFIGHYPHYPNEEAAVDFCRRIFPLIKQTLPDVRIKLVGSCPTEEIIRLSKIEGVELIANVADVNPCLQDASVFVTAFRRSAGIKGKVLEAMATGTPVVSTTSGACGINAVNGKEIFIADDPRDFAKYVIKLLSDDELYKRTAFNARKLVEEQYDWDKITGQLELVYQQLIQDGYSEPNEKLPQSIGCEDSVEPADQAVSNCSVDVCTTNEIENAAKVDQQEAVIEDKEAGVVSVSGTRDYEEFNQAEVKESIKKVDKIIEVSLDFLSAEKRLKMSSSYPEEFHIELTHSCNSRCITCDIWDYHQRNDKCIEDELKFDELSNLLKNSKYLREVKTVVLSGGEPFLRKDIVDITGLVTKSLPGVSLGILTNGVDTETIITKTKAILEKSKPDSFWIGSSLDGLGEIYDQMRGVKHGFQRFTETLERFKKELPGIKFSTTFVLTPFNVEQLIPCWEFSDKHNLDFFAQFGVPKAARSTKVFKWTDSDLAKIEKCILEIVGMIIAKSSDLTGFNNSLSKVSDKINLLTKIYYWSHLVDFQRRKKRFFHHCDAAFKFAMFDPYGNLFYCPLLKEKIIGNIRQKDFDRLWNSPEADKIRDFIETRKCSCWLVCTVFPIVGRALTLYGDKVAADLLIDSPNKTDSAKISNIKDINNRILNAASLKPQADPEESNAVELNNAEFRERKIALTSIPQGITIGSNYKCNAECMFCLGGEYQPFSLELYKRYFEPKLGSFLSQTGHVSFCGMGELLLTPDREEFLDYVNTTLPDQNKILTTNGLALNGNILSRVTESKYSVQISLHASNSSLHNQLTGIKGGFEKIINQIHCLVAKRKNKQSPYIALIFVVNTMNIEDLPQFVQLAASLGVDSIQCNYLTVFKPAHLKLSCFFKQDITNEMFSRAEELAEKLHIPLNIPPKFSHNGKDYFRTICSDPWKNIYVDTEGAVLPCCYSGEHFGELADADILSIWNNKKYQQLRQDLSSGEPLKMCKYCLKSNSANVNSLDSHVSFRPDVQKEVLNIKF